MGQSRDQESENIADHVSEPHGGGRDIVAQLIGGRLPRDVRWDDLLPELGKVVTVKMRAAGEVSILSGSAEEFFRIHSDGLVDLEDAARLRRILRASSSGADSEPNSVARVIIVVDHHEAKIYTRHLPSHDSEVTKLSPHDPHGFHRHLIHRKEAHYSGQRVPEDDSFFKAIIETIHMADEVILVGHGKGKSSEAQLLAAYIESHYPSVAKRIVEVEQMDLSAVSEAQIEQYLQSRGY